MITEYPETIDTFDEGKKWLKNIDDHIFKSFIKKFLISGSRYPFSEIHKDDRLPWDSLVDFVFSLNDLEIEERIKKLLGLLLLEYPSELNRGDHHRNYNPYEYIYNLLTTTTRLQVQSNGFSVMYDMAYNSNFLNKEAYGINLHYKLLKCLFSYYVPETHKDKIMELCMQNIDLDYCAPLCYRESFELDHSKAVSYLGKYFKTTKKINRRKRLKPINRFLNKKWFISAFEHNIDEFINVVLIDLLSLTDEFNPFKELAELGFDIQVLPSTDGPVRSSEYSFDMYIHINTKYADQVYNFDDLKKFIKNETKNAINQLIDNSSIEEEISEFASMKVLIS